MNQSAVEGRLAGYVAGQSPTAGVKADGYFHFLSFFFGDSGLHREHALKHGAAIAVNIARGGPDLCIGVAGQRFLNEIDEPGLALQCR